jgi:hypothetical protein
MRQIARTFGIIGGLIGITPGLGMLIVGIIIQTNVKEAPHSYTYNYTYDIPKIISMLLITGGSIMVFPGLIGLIGGLVAVKRPILSGVLQVIAGLLPSIYMCFSIFAIFVMLYDKLILAQTKPHVPTYFDITYAWILGSTIVSSIWAGFQLAGASCAFRAAKGK